MNATFPQVQPVRLPIKPSEAIECSDGSGIQREIPVLSALPAANWVPDETVQSWTCQRDAVIWCWLNQRHYIGVYEKVRRTMFASYSGLHAPHASRILKPDSKAPMDLPQRCVNAFESFTGWRGIRQFQLLDAELTVLEQVIAQKRRAA